MRIRTRIMYWTAGVTLWVLATIWLSGLLPSDPAPDKLFVVGLTLGLTVAILLPATVVAGVSLLLRRNWDKAMRLWVLLVSLAAIFLALGAFSLNPETLY